MAVTEDEIKQVTESKAMVSISPKALAKLEAVAASERMSVEEFLTRKSGVPVVLIRLPKEETEPQCRCNWDYGECHHALPKPPCGNVGTHFYFQPNPTTGEIMKLPLCDQCWRTQLSLQRLSPEEEEALVTQYTRDMMAKEEPGA